MTPQEISDYKRKWIMANYFESHTHTDLRSDVYSWCKQHCFQWRFDIKNFTDIYGDTVRFELKEDFDSFNEWYEEKWNEETMDNMETRSRVV